MSPTRIDLVMWTFNSGRTLEKSLRSIDRAIPPDRICHKIMVDGGSKDDTTAIGNRYGWETYHTQGGISHQANLALAKVDTPVYASFEHDILLARNWLPKVEAAISKQSVAVAQGIRLFTGSGTVAAMDRWNYEHHTNANPYASLDNNLYKTQIIRKVGGYSPPRPPLGTDSQLIATVVRSGYEWMIDRECISGHMRPSLHGYAKHVLAGQQREMIRFEGEQGPRPIARLVFSPLRGAQMAAKYHIPSTLIGYPAFRFFMFVVRA